jgi:beta-galactosidase GanA
VAPLGAPPEGVEVCRRAGAGKEVVVVLNHGAESQRLELPAPMRDVLTGAQGLRSLALAPRDVAVLVRE